jgi:hypothetical protein
MEDSLADALIEVVQDLSATINLLMDKEVFSQEEFKAAQAEARQRMTERYNETQIGKAG